MSTSPAQNDPRLSSSESSDEEQTQGVGKVGG
ncbi:Uncharacterised protein [Actinomyces viscosus]|uniref:Uncharacterized protein n=1 Tax=Actinomyces viscosus TaxID=1656 RepID=A0A3S4Z3U4_ACTVI|nr:Uncharacterised protein [Actinomyces viscosus]